MKIILSPAKKMNINVDTLEPTGLPAFIDKSTEILAWLKQKSEADLKKLWKCNDKIATLNVERLQHMDLRKNLTPAILAYEGIQYQYMAPGIFTDKEFCYVQDHLRILGVQISGAKIGSRATAYELEPELDSEGNPVPVAISGADRLRLAIAVLQALEGNGILGQVPSVDVTDITNVLLSYTTRFQVRLGDGENLTYKVGAMKQAVDQMEGYESGELDASFTLFPDKVVYSPLTQ